MELRTLAVNLGPKRELVRRHVVIAAGWPGGAVVREITVGWFLRELRGKLEEINSPVSIEKLPGLEFRIT